MDSPNVSRGDLEQPLVSCRPRSPRNSIKWSASPCLAILIHLQMVSHWLETPVNITSKSLKTSDAIRCVVKPTILSPKVGKITTSCVADYLSPYSRDCTCGRLLEPAIRGGWPGHYLPSFDKYHNCCLTAQRSPRKWSDDFRFNGSRSLSGHTGGLSMSHTVLLLDSIW